MHDWWGLHWCPSTTKSHTRLSVSAEDECCSHQLHSTIANSRFNVGGNPLHVALNHSKLTTSILVTTHNTSNHNTDTKVRWSKVLGKPFSLCPRLMVAESTVLALVWELAVWAATSSLPLWAIAHWWFAPEFNFLCLWGATAEYSCFWWELLVEMDIHLCPVPHPCWCPKGVVIFPPAWELRFIVGLYYCQHVTHEPWCALWVVLGHSCCISAETLHPCNDTVNCVAGPAQSLAVWPRSQSVPPGTSGETIMDECPACPSIPTLRILLGREPKPSPSHTRRALADEVKPLWKDSSNEMIIEACCSIDTESSSPNVLVASRTDSVGVGTPSNTFFPVTTPTGEDTAH